VPAEAEKARPLGGEVRIVAAASAAHVTRPVAQPLGPRALEHLDRARCPSALAPKTGRGDRQKEPDGDARCVEGVRDEGRYEQRARSARAVPLMEDEVGVHPDHELEGGGSMLAHALTLTDVQELRAHQAQPRFQGAPSIIGKAAVSFKRRLAEIAMPRRMDIAARHVVDSLGPFWLLLAGLTVKFVLLASLQGARRARTHIFRWPEDAAHWGGTVANDEDPLCARAQAALRNDGESQFLFVAAAALWIAAGAPSRLAYPVVAAYLVLRAAHSALLLWPRQPLRNRLFGLSLLCLLTVLGDSLRRLAFV